MRSAAGETLSREPQPAPHSILGRHCTRMTDARNMQRMTGRMSQKGYHSGSQRGADPHNVLSRASGTRDTGRPSGDRGCRTGVRTQRLGLPGGVRDRLSRCCDGGAARRRASGRLRRPPSEHGYDRLGEQGTSDAVGVPDIRCRVPQTCRGSLEGPPYDVARFERAVRRRYPLVVVRPRDLSDEMTAVWYVYRDGVWTSH